MAFTVVTPSGKKLRATYRGDTGSAAYVRVNGKIVSGRVRVGVSAGTFDYPTFIPNKDGQNAELVK